MVTTRKHEKGYLRRKKELQEKYGAEEAPRQAGEGKGFVSWKKLGQELEGRVSEVWSVTLGGEEREVATVEVATCTARVVSKNEDGEKAEVEVEVGDKVYLSLSPVDLRGRITEDDAGKWVWVAFTETKPTQKGNPKKVFDVLKWSEEDEEEYPDSADGDEYEEEAEEEEAEEVPF